jgi:hypothetical protein
MRKLIATFLLLSFNSYALPPVAVNGEQQTNAYVQNIKTPNSQTTSLGGIDTRIESGNTNLLVNPSFEHSIVTTGWTITNATGSANLTDMVEGKKDLSLALTAAMTVTQDSTVNAANLVGLQGVASIKIKTSDVTGLKVCVRNAGVTSTTLCVDVIADGTWKHVIIPFIMTATSNGIAITSTGITGTVKIDDAFVGTSDPFQNVNGESVFSAKVSNAGVVSDESGDFVNGNCVVSGTSIFTCTFSTSFFTVAPNCTALITDSNARVIWSTTQSSTQVVINTAFSTTGALSAQAFSLMCQKQGKDIPLASRIYSQSSRDYDWTAYTPTFGAGFGSVAAPNCFHQRRGHNLEVKCFPTSGTTTAAIGSITLPTGLTIDSDIIKATNTTAAAGQHVGEYQAAAGAGNNSWIVTALGTSTSAVYVAGTFAGSSSLIPSANIGGILGNSTLFSVKFTVPISGWFDYGVIVGSFAGVPSVPGGSGSIDTFSASYGATATTACTAPSTACAYLNQIGTVVTNITRGASAGIYTMNLGKTYAKLKCTATVANGTSSRQARDMRCDSCSSLVFNTQDSASTAADTQGTLICQGTY